MIDKLVFRIAFNTEISIGGKFPISRLEAAQNGSFKTDLDRPVLSHVRMGYFCLIGSSMNLYIIVFLLNVKKRTPTLYHLVSVNLLPTHVGPKGGQFLLYRFIAAID